MLAEERFPLSANSSMRSHPAGLSVIVVAWNTRELLRMCLRTVYAQGLPPGCAPLEVIVVDNASSDGSRDMVRGEFAAVRLVENPANLGFAAANNQGLRLASGRYQVLLNPDTELHPGALGALAEFLDGYPEAGAAGALLLNPDGSLQTSAYPMLGLGKELWRMFHLDRALRLASYPLEAWSEDGPRRVGVAQGACLALRREALDGVGLLDERYFMYTEEVDLCYRLAQAGWGVYWVPQARVLHFGGQSTRQVEAQMFLQLYESKVRFFRKHRGPWAARFYKLILAAASLPRVAFGAIPSPDPSASHPSPSSTSAHYRRLLGRLTHM